MTHFSRFSLHSKKGNGFTLVEVMVALVVAMFLLLMAERVLLEMFNHEHTIIQSWRRWTALQSGSSSDTLRCLIYSPYPSRIWQPEDIIWVSWDDVRLPLPCFRLTLP